MTLVRYNSKYDAPGVVSNKNEDPCSSCTNVYYHVITVIILSFDAEEKKAVSNALRRTTRNIYDITRSQLDNQIGYAVWDQAYKIANNHTESIIENSYRNNYVDNFMLSTGIDFVFNYDVNGSMWFNQTYDHITKKNGTLTIPNVFLKLQPNNPIMVNTAVATSRFAGMLFDGGSVFYVSAYPIVKSDFSTPPAGMLVWVKNVSRDVTDIAQRSQLCTTILGLSNDNKVMSSAQTYYTNRVSGVNAATFSAENPSWTNDLSPFAVEVLPNDNSLLPGRGCWHSSDLGQLGINRISALGVLSDYNGKKGIIIRSDIDRSLNILGTTSFGLALGVVGGLVIVISIVVLLFVELCVLRPVLRVTHKVSEIRVVNDPSIRVNVKRGDEIGCMADNINKLLDNLESSQKDIIKEQFSLQNLLQRIGIEEQRVRTIMNAIPDMIICILIDGTVHHANTAFYATTRYTAQDVNSTKNIKDIIPNIDLEEVISGRSTTTELVEKFRDHIPIILIGNVIDVVINDEQTKMIVLAARNINEKKKLMNNVAAGRNKIADMEKDMEFLSIWNNEQRRSDLKKYCKNISSEEHIKFLTDVDVYKNTRQQKRRADMQRAIFSKYLAKGSPYELNVSAKVSETYHEIAEGFGQIDLFDHLYKTVKLSFITCDWLFGCYR
ncbi:hypothetical protein AKO1_011194 [Acrasis kona]|uniref:HAMP domain-containing protein n=1 Tax=Acrasis kona TaxID=1008807 RepID=A0AAW2YWJ8_9EUKA